MFSGVGGRGCGRVVAWLGDGTGMGVSAGGDGEDPGAPCVTHRVAWLVGVGGTSAVSWGVQAETNTAAAISVIRGRQ